MENFNQAFDYTLRLFDLIILCNFTAKLLNFYLIQNTFYWKKNSSDFLYFYLYVFYKGKAWKSPSDPMFPS